jgi:hypothetical protein
MKANQSASGMMRSKRWPFLQRCGCRREVKPMHVRLNNAPVGLAIEARQLSICKPMITYLQGWEWVDEGKNGRHKWGFVTRTIGAELIFKVSSQGLQVYFLPEADDHWTMSKLLDYR